jgi:hypothetical protein
VPTSDLRYKGPALVYIWGNRNIMSPFSGYFVIYTRGNYSSTVHAKLVMMPFVRTRQVKRLNFIWAVGVRGHVDSFLFLAVAVDSVSWYHDSTWSGELLFGPRDGLNGEFGVCLVLRITSI